MRKSTAQALAEQVQAKQQASVQQSQMMQQKILRAITQGLKFLEEDTVIGPMKYSDGVSDLKWLLRQLGGGAFTINLDPEGKQSSMLVPGQADKEPPAGMKAGGNGSGES